MPSSWFTKSNFRTAREVIWVFILGFIIRLFVCQHTYIINPDGALYIHQARAIYFGQWDRLINCSIDYLSNYPLFIAGAYGLFHDWEMAARMVSLLFSWLTLIPLYLLLRNFFNEKISLLGTLIFALNPVFVSRSAYLIKGPTYWFFMVTGLYFFVNQINRRKRLHLLLSCLFFLLATWARVEAILFIILSFLYILFFERRDRIQKAVIFLTPIVTVIIVCLFNPVLFGISVNSFHRTKAIVKKFDRAVVGYKKIRRDSAELAGRYPRGIFESFLTEARKNVWLIALGTMLNRILEAFFYPLFLIFAVGLIGIREKIKLDRRLLLFILYAIFALVVLCAHVFQRWKLPYRFMALIIFPCAIFAGLGLENIVRFLHVRFRLKESLALGLVCLFIIVTTLPKNMGPRKNDDLLLKAIGNTIAIKEGNSHEVKVVASFESIRLLSFYANLNYPGAPCPNPYRNFKAIVGGSYDQFVLRLRKMNIKYFLWEEKLWPTKHYNFLSVKRVQHFIKVGQWNHPDKGMLILFEVT